jgi:hypothetical protein
MVLELCPEASAPAAASDVPPPPLPPPVLLVAVIAPPTPAAELLLVPARLCPNALATLLPCSGSLFLLRGVCVWWCVDHDVVAHA